MKDSTVSMVFKDVDKANKLIEQATFEEAIEATGYGKYNIILFLITIPMIFATMFETTTISYVVPVAQCDLNLDLEQKGYLISATYLGMVLSAMQWGFVSDTLGRRRCIIWGLFVNGFFVALGGVAQNFTMLLVAKFMGGFIINGPHAIACTIISEYHCAKHRARVILFLGVIFSLANIVLPIMALGIFSAPFDFHLFEWEFHSWNLLILITALPSFISALAYYLYVPETPKFLMTSGRNEEALKVFRTVYMRNTGNTADSYPIKSLVDETKIYNESHVISSDKWVAFKNGFKQMKPLFMPPYLSKIVLVCTLKLGTLMGLNSLRLWLPQLFVFINDYQHKHNSDGDICSILEENIFNNVSIHEEFDDLELEFAEDLSFITENEAECTVNYSNTFVYYNLMIISVGTVVGYLFITTLINLLGKKVLYVSLGLLSGLSAIMIYYSKASWLVTTLATTTLALSGINSNVLLTIIVDIFPTSLRTTTVALALMVARLGSMIGNMIFPFLINAGCWPPFVYVGSTTCACALLAILLPKTDMKALQ